MCSNIALGINWILQEAYSEFAILYLIYTDSQSLTTAGARK